MYTIRFIAHCPGGNTEVLSDALEHTARVIEEAISLRLLELFETVIVDDVTVEYEPPETERGEPLSPAA